MLISHNLETKSVDNDNYILVNVWSGTVGHASLHVKAGSHEDYLSLWPVASIDPDKERNASLKSFEADCYAEARIGEAKRFPESVYKLVLTKEKAMQIYQFVQEVRQQVDENKIHYTIVNNKDHNAKNVSTYNCSGMIEHVLTENLDFSFGDPSQSLPRRVAQVMHHINSVEIVREDEKLQRSLSEDEAQRFQNFRANM